METDLAELIVQLGDDQQSHILVPAIHRNRAEIRELFRRELDRPDLTDEPAALAEAARLHLRQKFLSARMGVSGANFALAETGTVCVVESEGNGRMCTTLPEVLVTLMGVEKILSSWRDMEVFLQLLPRSSTGERMNPYTSFWSGVREGDGPASSISCCSTTAARTRWPMRWDARLCAAFAAAPASTSAPSTRGWEGTPTSRSTLGRSGRS